MDNVRPLLELAARLVAAADKRDWSALAEADRALAGLAERLAAQAALSEAERDALARARAAHRIASQRCATESGRLADVLEGMRSRREGWVAYTLAEQWNEAAS